MIETFETNITNIGNSKGLIIPNYLFKHKGLKDKVKVTLEWDNTEDSTLYDNNMHQEV